MATEVVARDATPAPPGRRSQLTSRLADDIARAIRAGVPRKHAAASKGVGESTLMWWLQLGRQARVCEVPACTDTHHGPHRGEGDISYLEFLEQVEQADADAVVIAQGHWSTAMKGDWRAAAAWLERRHPEYRRTDRVELTGAEGGVVEIAVTARTRLRDAIEATRRRMPGAEEERDAASSGGDGPPGR